MDLDDGLLVKEEEEEKAKVRPIFILSSKKEKDESVLCAYN